MVMVFKKFFWFKVFYNSTKSSKLFWYFEFDTTVNHKLFQTTKQPSNEHQQKSYDHLELLELVAIQVLCFHFKVMTLFKFRWIYTDLSSETGTDIAPDMDKTLEIDLEKLSWSSNFCMIEKAISGI